MFHAREGSCERPIVSFGQMVVILLHFTVYLNIVILLTYLTVLFIKFLQRGYEKDQNRRGRAGGS